MASLVTIPERVSQCRMYLDNRRQFVTGTLTLPNFERPTVDVSGAGIAGTISTPTRGSLNSLRASFNARVLTDEAFAAFSMRPHSLEFRAVIQGRDNLGNLTEQLFSCWMNATPVSLTSGTIDNGAEMGVTVTLEVTDILINVNGVVLCNVSKTNNIVQFRDATGALIDENAAANIFLA